MAQEIGIAYVTVAPSAKGFGKAVEGEIDQGVSGATKSADGKLKSLAGKVAKWGSIAVAAVGTAITGLALKGGISRALNIEDAQAKLRGLGHDAQSVEAIMTSALAAVKGTAFGLDAAATTAAGAVAAGIKPGQELEKYLRLTADAATIAGTSMSEMGSILNRVQTQGRAYSMELNMLADRGIPIYQWLAEEYGVTAEALRKMVAAGEVDAATYRKVIEENIGGAALASGDTVRGAFANMGAALSRIGASAITPFVGLVQESLKSLIPLADSVAAAVGPAAAELAEKIAPYVREFLAMLSGEDVSSGPLAGLVALLNPLGALIKEILPGFMTLGGQVQALVSSLGAALAPLLPVIADALLAVVSAAADLAPILGDALVSAVAALAPALPVIVGVLAALLDAVRPLLPILGDALTSALGVLTPLVGVLGEAFAQIFAAIKPLFPVLAEIASAILPVLVKVVGALMAALAPVVSALAGALAKILPIVADLLLTVWDAISPLLDVIVLLVEALAPVLGLLGELVALILPPLIQLVAWLIEGIVGLVAPLIEQLAPALQAVGEWFQRMWDEYVRPAIDALRAAWDELWPHLVALWEQYGAPLVAVIQEVIRNVQVVWSAVWDAISTVVSIAWSYIQAAVENALAVVRGVITTVTSLIRGDWSGAWEAIKATVRTVWNNIVTTVLDAVGKVIDSVSGIKGKVLAVFANARDWLLDAGGRIIQGLIDGIRSGFDRVKGVLQDLTGKLPDWKGPAVVDRALLVKPAQLVMDGFIEGLESRFADVRATLGDFTGDLAASVSVSGQVVGEGPDVLTRDDLADFARELADRLAVASARIAEGRLDLAGEQLRALSYQGGEVTI